MLLTRGEGTMNSVYISGAITNNPHYLTDFKEVENRLIKEYDNVINPADMLKDMSEKTPYWVFMRICLGFIDTVDTIYMMRGWKESKGARFEHEYADIFGKEIVYE